MVNPFQHVVVIKRVGRVMNLLGKERQKFSPKSFFLITTYFVSLGDCIIHILPTCSRLGVLSIFHGHEHVNTCPAYATYITPSLFCFSVSTSKFPFCVSVLHGGISFLKLLDDCRLWLVKPDQTIPMQSQLQSDLVKQS